MKKSSRKNIIFFAAFLIAQFLLYLVFYHSTHYLSVNCTSTFTRNSYQDYNFFFNGSFTVILRKDGTGELTIKAYSDEDTPKQVGRTYAFDYKIVSNGQLYTHIKSENKSATDTVDDAFYRKYFFDLAFDSAGQIRIHKFKNTFLFMSPDIIISACSPLE